MTQPELQPGPSLVNLLTAIVQNIDNATASRDRLLVDLAELGYSSRDLAQLVGLSHTSVARIVRAGRNPR